MARELNKLSSVEVKGKRAAGLYGDGGGLYLQVTSEGAKTWIYRFMLNGRRRDMGLGATHTIGLADARGEAQRCRQLVRDGVDPIERRRAEKLAARAANAKRRTFKECGEAYVNAHEAAWQNAKHAGQWSSTLETYAYPTLGALPVDAINTGLVMDVLSPIWNTKTETAGRLRGRIEAILDWATVQGHRSGENPARWRGHLDKLLPARAKIQRVEHHAALPYNEIGAFLKALRSREGTSARALEFAILTAARTGEVIGARWDEFDLADKVWIIPAERMKGRKEHRVPLTAASLAIVEEMKGRRADGCEIVFTGPDNRSAMSNMGMLALLKRMGRDDLTAHGFRSTFRDWAAERSNFPREVIEMALAHAIESKVEAAYRRGDLFEKRRRLMDAWASYCARPAAGGSNVAQLSDAKRA